MTDNKILSYGDRIKIQKAVSDERDKHIDEIANELFTHTLTSKDQEFDKYGNLASISIGLPSQHRVVLGRRELFQCLADILNEKFTSDEYQVLKYPRVSSVSWCSRSPEFITVWFDPLSR